MKKYSASLYVILSGILWGLLSIFVRNLSAFGLSSMQIGLCRCGFAALILAVFLLIRSPEQLKIHLRDIWCFIGTGVISVSLFNYCYFTTITLSQASIAVMLLYTSPIFVMLMSALLFHEKMTLQKGVALVSTFLGCILVAGVFGGSYALPAKVVVIGLAAGFFYALYSIFGPYALKRYKPLTVTVYTFIFASIGSIPLADVPGLVHTLFLEPRAVAWCVGLSVCSTILPYALYTLGLSRMESGRAAILATVEPLVGAIIGICLYGEPHNATKLLGMALIFFSVIVLNLNFSHRSKRL